MTTRNDIPAIFTPDNEPYLGRESLYTLDKEIRFSLWVSSHIAAFTLQHRPELSELQRAACQIVPQGIGLALSIRELIRQAYLFGALVLTRPLIERAAIISYICDHPEAVEKWHAGWNRWKRRPRLAEMLHSMAHSGADYGDAQAICEHFGNIVHGNPASAEWNSIALENGARGYSVGKILNRPDICDELALQGWAYLRILVARATSVFPEVRPPSAVPS